MTRRCSHCSHNGHNSRTCPNKGGVRLFGVRLTEQSSSSIRKSASMGNLTHYSSGGGFAGNLNESGGGGDTPDHGGGDGYGSEDFVAGSSSRERKKGTPWTEEEHRMFLLGLQKLGKGDWRGISRNYVMSRTPTQVASHAQKYFIRQSNCSRRKRRSSLFDITADESVDTPMESHDFFSTDPPPQPEPQVNTALPPPPPLEEECESMDSTSNSTETPLIPQPIPEASPCLYPVVFPTYIPQFIPYPVPMWPQQATTSVQADAHEVLKPTAIHTKNPINVDELVGMSQLSLGESIGDKGPSSLSLKLLDGAKRQSAFHANPETGASASGPIHAL